MRRENISQRLGQFVGCAVFNTFQYVILKRSHLMHRNFQRLSIMLWFVHIFVSWNVHTDTQWLLFFFFFGNCGRWNSIFSLFVLKNIFEYVEKKLVQNFVWNVSFPEKIQSINAIHRYNTLHIWKFCWSMEMSIARRVY